MYSGTTHAESIRKRAKEAINEWHTDATKEAQRKYQQAEGFGGKFMAAVENRSYSRTTLATSQESVT